MARPTPASISGCTSWFRGDFAGTSVAGDPVSIWNDQSGQGRDATQGTASARPTRTDTPKPGAVWSSTQRLVSTESRSNTAQTVFTVALPKSNTGERTLIGGNVDGAVAFRILNQKINWVIQGRATLTSGATVIPLDTVSIMSGNFTTSGQQVYLNGAQDGSSTASFNVDSPRTMTIGTGYNGGEAWIGTIFEVITYNRVLTASERAQVHSYLSDRYGITVADYVADTSADQITWWDGSTEVAVTFEGVWDGSALVAARFEGLSA